MSENTNINAMTPKKTLHTKEEKCYFCGNLRHPRIKCPARNFECRNCHKIGHWAQVCKGNVTATIREDSGPSLL